MENSAEEDVEGTEDVTEMGRCIEKNEATWISFVGQYRSE